jgi:hypothetical protein
LPVFHPIAIAIFGHVGGAAGAGALWAEAQEVFKSILDAVSVGISGAAMDARGI